MINLRSGRACRLVRWAKFCSAVIFALSVFACASNTPPSRLDAYLGEAVNGSASGPLPTERPIRASLIVLDRDGGSGTIPALPEEAQARIVSELANELNRTFPLVVEKVIAASELPSGTGMSDLMAFGKQRQLPYLLVAMLSSEEQEYPVSLFLGWTTHRQPGFRRDNWSLAEVALVDVQGEQVVLQAEGRAWATLDSPTAPGINQWYPVIYLRPQDPERRIWPPSYEGAPITLRVVSMTHAAKRLALNFQEAWNDKRQTEVAGVQR